MEMSSVQKRGPNDSMDPAFVKNYTPLHPHFHVWRAASSLLDESICPLLKLSDDVDNNTVTKPYSYVNLVHESSYILRQWGATWETKDKFKSLLNKPSLRHEIEESIVAIRGVLIWLDQTSLNKKKNNNDNPEKEDAFTMVDLCCGKGIMSMLLSYLCDRPSIREHSNIRKMKHIVMVDKSIINWDHIHESNRNASPSSDEPNRRSMGISTWGGINIHDESFLDRLLEYNETTKHKLLIVGIHLCKTLSPRAIGIFNQLGQERAPFLQLAPCCLPRLTKRNGSSNSIDIPLYETNDERSFRKSELERRNRARQFDPVCYICNEAGHRVRFCPTLPSNGSEEERTRMISEAKSKGSACWRCGEYGHHRSVCPTVQTSCLPARPVIPCVSMDLTGVAASKTPFDDYCKILTNMVQNPVISKELKVTTLDADADMEKKNNNDHANALNWNATRKCTWIIVSEI
eukprot:CAMPEP_0195509080 /NCGR_PEP_ID=MMETSP0794_2-20130614/2109_1 /TAXON_ID=515487 /ORGANISM="Stephanopyxis turris, Strain CCMP 815" /LENGTH=459 /DNA_ID=CAMNT_0040636203 /DNA_START=81 /DNA_END=1460 /DNA_ORIENTATION=+